jgi:NitT/TauT family transport system permease protein
VIGAVIGEYVASERGLGYLQMQATSQFDTTLNFASVVVISLVGVVLYFVLAAFEARLVFRRDHAR